MTAKGELIERLVELMTEASVDVDPGRWRDAGAFLSAGLGGRLVGLVGLPDDEVPPPGSLLETLEAEGRTVNKTEWAAHLRSRLTELTDFGVSEDLLVVGCVQYAEDMYYRRMADTGETDRRRRELREDVDRMLDDPARLAGFRSLLPDRDEANDEEIRASLQRMKAELADASPDRAAEVWAQLDAWRADVSRLLSGEILDNWRRRAWIPPSS